MRTYLDVYLLQNKNVFGLHSYNVKVCNGKDILPFRNRPHSLKK